MVAVVRVITGRSRGVTRVAVTGRAAANNPGNGSRSLSIRLGGGMGRGKAMDASSGTSLRPIGLRHTGSRITGNRRTGLSTTTATAGCGGRTAVGIADTTFPRTGSTALLGGRTSSGLGGLRITTATLASHTADTASGSWTLDPLPTYWANDWYDSDDVYVDYENDGYYMYNRRYPGAGIAIGIDF